MSIINTMLQDLDKRNGRPGGEAVAGDAIRSIKPASPWQLRQNTVLMLLGLMAVSLAGFWWMQQRHAAQVPIVVPAPPVPFVAGMPAPAAPPSSPAPTVAPPAAVEPTAVAKAAAPAHAVKSAVPPVGASPAPMHAAALPRTPGIVAAAPTAPETIETSAPPAKTVAANAKAAGGKTYTPAQVSANRLGEAIKLDEQGRQEDAKAPLQRALSANPLDLQARQMLIRLQMDTGRVEEARALLTDGQRLHPERSDFTLALARLDVEAGDSTGAIQLLEAGRAAARDEPQYHALLAALLLRTQRYDEAVQHYLVALRADPANARWLVGAGVALEGIGKQADAAEAYRRAEGAPNLTPEMATFLSDRLVRLGGVERRQP